jgi:prefoldin subunit 5
MARIWESTLSIDNRNPSESIRSLEIQAEFLREEIERLKGEIKNLEELLHVIREAN